LSFGSGGGSNSGEIRYVISVDDSQAIQKLQGVSQNFQQLQQGAQQAAQGVQQLPQALDQTTTSAGKFSQANADMAAELQATDIAAKQSSTSQQSFGSVVKQNLGTIVSMASGILGLVSSYTSLQRTQLQINKLEVTEANQRRMLDVLTRKHAEAVAKYGASSQEALDIEAKINVLQERHINTLDQINIRQEQQTQQQIAFGLSVVQTGASVVQMASQLKTYEGAAVTAKVATIGLSNSMTKLKIATVIGAILVAIEVAAQAVANNFGGIQQKLNEFYNWLVKLAPVFQPVIDAIWTIGQALTALFTGDIDALTKMFSQSAQTAPKAITGVDGFTDSINESGKAIAKADQEIIDMWDEVSKAPNLTSALNIKVDKDKITKKILDYLPDSLSKDIKVQIKGEQSIAAIKDSFAEIFNKATKDPKFADKDANKLASGYMKFLKEKFPNAPGSKEMQAALAATISGPDTESQLKKLIEQWKLDPNLVIGTNGITIDPAGLEKARDDAWDAAFAAPAVHRDFLNGVDVTKSPFQKFADDAIAALKPLTDALPNTTKLIGDLVSKISAAVVQTWNNFSSAVSTIADWLTELIAPQGWAIFVQGIDDAIVATWNAFSSSISIIADWLTELIAPQGWAVFIAGVDDAIVATWNAFSTAITTVADWMTELIAPKGWDTFWKSVNQTVVDVWNSFSSAVSIIADWMTELIAPKGWGVFLNQVNDAVVSTWNAFSSTITVIADWLTELIAPDGWDVFLKSVSEAIASTWNAFSSTISIIADWLTELIAPEGWTTFVNTVSDTIVNTWNSFASAISGLANNLKALFGLNPPTWLKDPVTGNLIPPKIPDKGPKADNTTPSSGVDGNGNLQFISSKLGGGPGVAGQIEGFAADVIMRLLPEDIKNQLAALRKNLGEMNNPFTFQGDRLMEKRQGYGLVAFQTGVNDSLTDFANKYMDAFGKGLVSKLSQLVPTITPAALKPGVQLLNASLNKAFGPLGAGILGGIGEEKTIKSIPPGLTASQANTYITTGKLPSKTPPTTATGGNLDTTAITTAAQTAQKAIQSLTTYGIKNLAALGKAAATAFNSVANYAKGAIVFLQTFQKAIQSIASFSTKNLTALGKAAKTNFNSVANYASGATTFIQVLQIAINSMVKLGVKNLVALGKASKTNFNSVANYANGATTNIQTLQKAIDSMVKLGIKNIAALAKASKTNFNTVANYASGATKAVNALQTAIDNLKSKTITITVNKTGSGLTLLGGGGTITSLAEGGIVSAAQGFITHGPQLLMVGDNPSGRETVAVVPHNDPWPTMGLLEKQFGRGGNGDGSTVNQVINLKISGSDIINERNLSRRIKFTVGENRDKFGS